MFKLINYRTIDSNMTFDNILIHMGDMTINMWNSLPEFVVAAVL